MINKNFTYKEFEDPFPHFTVENFFEDDFYKELEEFFPDENEFQKNVVNRMHGDTTFGDKLYENLLMRSPAYKKLNAWVYSEDFFNFFVTRFKKYFSDQKDLFIDLSNFTFDPRPREIGKVYDINNFQKKNKSYFYSRLDIGFGKKNYGADSGGKGPHIDNPQRLISVLFFVGGFNSITGGEHRLYKKVSEDLVIDKIYPVKKNFMIASLQNNVAFHDVNPIEKIDGKRNAYYMAISSSKKIWRDCNNSKINIRYNKNRIKKNLLEKTLSKIRGIFK